MRIFKKKGMALVLAGLLAWSPLQSFSAFAAVKTEEELAQMPGSEVVINSLFKEGAALNPEAPAYGSMERVSVEGQPFAEAIRFTTSKEPASTYSFQYVLPVESAMDKDDVLLASFYARTISSSHETAEGKATLVMEKKEVWSQSLKEEIAIPSEWKRFLIPVKAALVMEENTAQVTVRMGYKPQVVEVADLKVINYKKALAFDELPSTPVIYDGMEEDAPWREEANRRIEQLRKGDLDVVVKDRDGQPIAGADVRVSMTKHDFKFGTAVSSDMLFAATPEAEMYRTKLQENFNAAVMENDMKWPWWEKDKAMAVKSYNWLGEKGFAVRGHNLIWEGATRLPEDIPGLISNPAALNKRIEDHFHETAGVFRGRLLDWDVVNEPVLNSLIRTGTGNYAAMADWLKWAKEADPYAKLYINETQILGVDAPVIKSFSDLLQGVKDRGAPLDGVGIQGHFGSTPVSPMAFYNQLTHFTQYAPELAITEFDMNSPKEDIQGKFTRDILLAAFSHPNVESFTMWGFWDGKHWQNNAPLFRKDWSLKPSGEQWRKLVYGDWWTDVSGQSGGDGHFRTRGFYGDYDITVTRDGISQTVKASLLKGQENKVTVVWGEEGPASGTAFIPLPVPAQTGDITPPVWPFGEAFAVSETTPTSVTLQWPAAKDNVAVDHYVVRMNGQVLTEAVSGSVTRYDVTRLEPGADYAFNVEAVHAKGNRSAASPELSAATVAGRDNTLPGWTKGSYLTLSGLEETAAGLSWPPGVDNDGIAGYRIYVNGQAVGDTADTRYPLTGLTGNTLYTVRVEGQDSDGNLSLGGPIVIFRTPGASDTAPPVWPAASALKAGDITAENLQLQWDGALDSVGVEAYRLFKDGVELVTLPASASIYEVSGLSPHTTYSFKVEAGDFSGNWSVTGPAFTATTKVTGDAAAPVWPEGRALTYRSLSDHSVSLDWTAAQDDTALAAYRLYRNGTVLETVYGDVLQYTAAGLEPGTPYTFRVEAGDASGSWTADGPSVMVQTFSGVVRKEQRIYPSDDAFIQAPAVFGGDGTTLNLEYLRFKNAAGVSGSETNKNTGNNRRAYLKFPLQTVTGQVYKASLHLYIYEVQTPNLDISMDLYAVGDNWSETAINWRNKPEEGTKLGSTVVRNAKYWKELAVDGYVASKLAADSAGSVSFKLQDDAWKDQNVDMYSKESTVSGAVYRPYLLVGTEEMPVDEAPPEWNAAHLQADRLTPQSVTLSWAGAQDGQGINRYVIYQNDVEIAQVGSDVRSYTVRGLASSTAYTFRVEAKDAAQESATGPVLLLQTPQADGLAPVWPTEAKLTASGIDRHTVSLAWTPAEDQYGVAAYEIYLEGERLADVPGMATAYRAEGLEPGKAYSFRISALDEAGNAADGPSLQVTTSPADTVPPQWKAGSTLAASGISATGVWLSWPEALDDTGVTQYKLFNGDVRVALLEPGVRGYYAVGLTPGTSCRFAVTAVDAAGNTSALLELDELKTLEHDTITPQWPTGSKLTAVQTGDKVTLTWDAAVDNAGILRYELYHNGVL
ncbi:MAG: Beta,4-xylanase, partial [Paenibacillaceae bacterium]|nr:Beta,4-xylanase [Paenibacillaceae bacterium]